MGSRGARSRSDASAELILARESRTGGPPFPRGSLRELLGHEAEQSPGAEERLLRRRHRQPEELHRRAAPLLVVLVPTRFAVGSGAVCSERWGR